MVEPAPKVMLSAVRVMLLLLDASVPLPQVPPRDVPEPPMPVTLMSPLAAYRLNPPPIDE